MPKQPMVLNVEQVYGETLIGHSFSNASDCLQELTLEFTGGKEILIYLHPENNQIHIEGD